MAPLDPSLERAFVATLYLLGESRRADENCFALGADARPWCARSDIRPGQSRALALAREVAKITLALDAESSHDIAQGPRAQSAGERSQDVDPGGIKSRAGRLLKSALADASASGFAEVRRRRGASPGHRGRGRRGGARGSRRCARRGAARGAAEVAAALIKLRTEEAEKDERQLDRPFELATAMAERLIGETLGARSGQDRGDRQPGARLRASGPPHRPEGAPRRRRGSSPRNRANWP